MRRGPPVCYVGRRDLVDVLAAQGRAPLPLEERGSRGGASARRAEGGAEELPGLAEVERGARRRVEANGGVQRPDQEGSAGAH